MAHELTHKRLLRSDGTVIEAGDRFEATDAELRAFGDRITTVDDQSSEQTHETSESGDETETDEESEDSETKTCAGNDGDCSREVGEDEEFCWQHSSDSDSDE